jgi:Cu/Ag efflux pump CusA
MRWIIDASLKARIPVFVIALALLFVGYTNVRDASVDTLPEFGPTTVEIQTEALGLSAAEVEQLITLPMEQDLLNGVAWLQLIRSKSVPGLSSIELQFEPGTDPYKARLAVQERVSQAKVALPGVSQPPQMLQPLSSTNRVMIIGVSSSNLSPIEMSVLARWTIRPRLMGVEGVANVSIWGQRDRQMQVLVDPQHLQDRGVSLLQVVESTANALWVSPLTFVEASTPGTSGFIDTPNQRLGIQHILPISSPDELAQVTVEETNMRLGDVAEVVEDHQPLIGDAVINNGPGLLLVVEKFPEASTLDTTREVERAIDDLRPGLGGLEFDSTVFRPATSIERGLDDLEVAAIVGLVLVALVLGLFFLQWRTALICLVVIPLSLVAAQLMLSLRGETINVVVVAGLIAALGLVIDDVVTGTQNVLRRIRQHRGEAGDKPIAAMILESTLEVSGPMAYAALIVGAAVVPVFFMKGLAGEFFPPLALSYLLAVVASTIVALVFTPALSLFLFSIAPSAGEEPPVGRWLERNYGAVLTRIFKTPRPILFAAFAMVVIIGLVAVPLLHRPSLLPSFREDELLIQVDGAPGTSLPEMNRITDAIGGELRAIPGVSDVGGHVGRAVMADQVVGVNSGELWVTIDPGADYDATVSAIHEAVDGYPGLSRSVVTYSDEKVDDARPTQGEDMTVRIHGEDLGVLKTEGAQVQQVLSGIDGIVDAHVDLPAEEPTVEIEVDLAAAQRHGLEPGTVRRTAATLLSGITVGSLFEHDKVFDVIVRGTPQTRESLTSINELLLDKPDGSRVRLAEVAHVRIAPNPTVIEREGVSRRLDVVANISGRGRGAVVQDVEQALRGMDFPLEYHGTVLEPKDQGFLEAPVLFVLAAAIAIFLLLQSAFGSWRLAFLAFSVLPIALVGGVFGALVDGGDLTIGSYAGLLTLLAIAARGGILFINRCQRLQSVEDEPFGAAIVLRAAQERIAPVLMTASATAVGLLALMLVGDVFARDIVRPMVFVIMGGLVSSTLLTLFIMPTLYLVFAPGPETVPSRAKLIISQKEVPA